MIILGAVLVIFISGYSLGIIVGMRLEKENLSDPVSGVWSIPAGFMYLVTLLFLSPLLIICVIRDHLKERAGKPHSSWSDFVIKAFILKEEV